MHQSFPTLSELREKYQTTDPVQIMKHLGIQAIHDELPDYALGVFVTIKEREFIIIPHQISANTYQYLCAAAVAAHYAGQQYVLFTDEITPAEAAIHEYVRAIMDDRGIPPEVMRSFFRQ